MENKPIGYTDDSTQMAVIRVTVTESLIHDLGRVNKWCDLWGMKLNASMTKTMIISRSHTMHPQSPPLTIGRTVLKDSDDLVILGVTFDSKLTFEKYLCLASKSASQRCGILKKSWRVFHDRSLLERCFWGLSSPFWSTILQCGAQLPIHTLNYWTVQSVAPSSWLGVCLSAILLIVNLLLCMLCKIRCNVLHPLNDALPGPYVPVRVTHGAFSANRYAHEPPHWKTSHYRRTFVPLSVSLWKDLANPYLKVWDWQVSREGPMIFYWPMLLYPYYSLLLFFPFSSSCL